SPRGPRRELFARRPRKKEEVDVRPRPSDDAGMRANRPGPGYMEILNRLLLSQREIEHLGQPAAGDAQLVLGQRQLGVDVGLAELVAVRIETRRGGEAAG